MKWFLFALVLLGGCSLSLDSSLDGHACGPDGACLDGYVCSAENICVKPDKAACNPACSPVEACYKQQCVPVCDGRACPAGMECTAGKDAPTIPGINAGICVAVDPAQANVTTQQEGFACTSDADCGTGSAPNGAQLYCLIPYGGHSSGFCTASCRTDADCGGKAPKCKAFRSELGDGTINVCAAESFTACTSDADCSNSGLVCGIYSTGSTLGKNRSVAACRSPIGPANVGVGQKCDAQPCANGLCVQESTNSNDHICTATCTTNQECDMLFGVMAGSACLDVTVGGRVNGDLFPHVRSKMCVPKGLSLDLTCSTTVTTPQCNVFAPTCVQPVPMSGMPAPTPRCAQHCTDGKSSDGHRCPDGFVCQVINEDNFCVAP